MGLKDLTNKDVKMAQSLNKVLSLYDLKEEDLKNLAKIPTILDAITSLVNSVNAINDYLSKSQSDKSYYANNEVNLGESLRDE